MPAQPALTVLFSAVLFSAVLFSAVLFNAGAQPLAAQGAFLQGGQAGIGIRTALKFAQRIARLLAALLLFFTGLLLFFLPQPLCTALLLHLLFPFAPVDERRHLWWRLHGVQRLLLHHISALPARWFFTEMRLPIGVGPAIDFSLHRQTDYQT